MGFFEQVPENLELLVELLQRYLSEGFFFFLAHLALAYLIIHRSWFLNIRREIEALRAWEPSDVASPAESEGGLADSSRRQTDAVEILDRFVEQCRVLGEQGFFVPMTDFSDRLDSMIDGILTDLYNRINMLLIVGIAGSLFGLFEFAVRGTETLLADDWIEGQGPVVFSDILSSSMAKAFPVGFVGLVLMLFFQVWAAYPEHRLRAALAQATKRALDAREKHSRSQAKVVEDAARSIGDAMKPLENLEATLTKSVQPVVAEFSKQMEKALAFFENQFKDLGGATGEVRKAVAAVERNVEILRVASDRLEKTLATAPQILDNTIRLQEQQEEAFQRFADRAGEAITELRESLGNFGGLLGTVIDNYRETLDAIRNALSEAAQKSIDDLQQGSSAMYEGLTKRYGELFDRIDTDLGELRTGTLDAAQRFRGDLVTAAEALQGLRELPVALSRGIEQQVQTLGERTFDSLRSSFDQASRDLVAVLEGHSNRLNVSIESFGAVVSRIDELQDKTSEKALGSIDALSTRAETMLDSISKTAREQLVESADGFFAALRPQTAELTDRLGKSVEEFHRQANEAAAALTGLSDLPAKLGEKVDATFSEIRDQSLAFSRNTATETQENLRNQLEVLATASRQRLEETEKVIAGLEGRLQQIGELLSSLLRTAEDSIPKMIQGSLGRWHEQAMGLTGAMRNDYDKLYERIGVTVEKIENSAVSAARDLSENIRQASAGLEELQKLPQDLNARLDETLTGVSTESITAFREVSGELGRTAQDEFISRQRQMSEQMGETQKTFQEAAEQWHRLAVDAKTTFQDAIKESMGEAREFLGDSLRDLDLALKERYPQIIADIDRFSQGIGEVQRQVVDLERAFSAAVQEAAQMRGALRESPVAMPAMPSSIADDQRRILETLGRIDERLETTQHTARRWPGFFQRIRGWFSRWRSEEPKPNNDSSEKKEVQESDDEQFDDEPAQETSKPVEDKAGDETPKPEDGQSKGDEALASEDEQPEDEKIPEGEQSNGDEALAPKGEPKGDETSEDEDGQSTNEGEAPATEGDLSETEDTSEPKVEPSDDEPEDKGSDEGSDKEISGQSDPEPKDEQPDDEPVQETSKPVEDKAGDETPKPEDDQSKGDEALASEDEQPEDEKTPEAEQSKGDETLAPKVEQPRSDETSEDEDGQSINEDEAPATESDLSETGDTSEPKVEPSDDEPEDKGSDEGSDERNSEQGDPEPEDEQLDDEPDEKTAEPVEVPVGNETPGDEGEQLKGDKTPEGKDEQSKDDEKAPKPEDGQLEDGKPEGEQADGKPDETTSESIEDNARKAQEAKKTTSVKKTGTKSSKTSKGKSQAPKSRSRKKSPAKSSQGKGSGDEPEEP